MILAALRGGAPPNASALACAMAARVLAEEGRPATMTNLAELTGYARSSLYRARDWLEEWAPGWRPAASAPLELAALEHPEPPHTNGNGNGASPVPVGPPPSWRAAVNRRADAVAGRRTWDLYADVYALAADDVFAAGQIGDLVALTVDYLESVTEEDVSTAERRRVAQIVRTYGKAALYGIHEAIPRAEVGTIAEYVRYAVAVAKNVHHRLAQQNGAHT